MNGNTSIPLADQLTATQKKALKLDGSMAIAAGPGSGKSTTLVVRYLKAVRACDYDVSRVLAVTFTKKAAAELSKRIRDKVRLLAAGRAVLDASSDDAARWADVLDHLPDAWVTTLHGFCQRYLATLPPDKDLGYRFAVIESEAPNHPAGDVIDALIAEAALAGGAGTDALRDVYDWVVRFGENDLKKRLSMLLRHRHVADAWARSEKRTDDDLRRIGKALHGTCTALDRRSRERSWRRLEARVVANPLHRARLVEAARAILEIQVPKPRGDTGVAKLLQGLRELLEHLESADGGGLAVQMMKWPSVDGVPRIPSPKKCDSETCERWKNAWTTFHRRTFGLLKLDELNGLEADGESEIALDSLFDPQRPGLENSLRRIYEECLEMLREAMRAANLVDFDGLIDVTLERLEATAAGGAMRRPFKFVLIDEFQDTDPRQWKLAQLLCPHPTDGNGVGEGLCLVGDAQQAIYAFRQGDVETFRKAVRDVGNGGRGSELQLDTNFRSTPTLVAFNNQLATGLFPGAGMTPEPFEAVVLPMEAHRGVEASSASRLLFIVEKAKTADERRHAEALRVASLIHDEIVGKWPVHLGNVSERPARLGDIAILMPKRTGLADLESALGATNIRYRTLGGVGFFAQAEVKMLVAVLAWIANPSDDVALLGIVRSALFGVDDGLLAALRPKDARIGLRRRFRENHLAACALTSDERARLLALDATLTRWSRLAASLPASSLLEVVIRDTGVRFAVGHADPSGRAEANMDLLLSKIRGLEDEGEGSYATLARSFVQSIEDDERGSQADPPIDGEAVTLMTIHGSKGLEFPIVILFDMGAKPSTRTDESPPPWVGRVGNEEVISVEIPNDKDSGLQKLMKNLSSHKDEAERARLLFVATTRAEDHLVVTGSVEKDAPDKKTPLEAFERALGIDLLEPGVLVLDSVDGGRPVNVEIRCGVSDEGATEVAMPSLTWVDPGVDDVVVSTTKDAIHVRAYLRPTMFGKAKACSRRWFLESALRAPGEEPWKMRGAEGPKTGVRANVRGNAIHAAFESLAFGRKPSDPIGGTAAASGSKATPRDHIDVACMIAGIADASDVKEIRTLVERAEKAFAAWDIGARILTAKPGEVRSEQSVSFEVDGLEVAGTLDLLYVPEGDGPVYVVDYKSDGGAEIPDTVEKARAKGYADQLVLYCVAIARLLRRPVEGWLFLTATGRPLKVIGDDEIRRGEAEVAALARSARLGYPKTTDASHCEACVHLRPGRCGGVGSSSEAPPDDDGADV